MSKKIRVKVKKRRINFKRVLLILLILYLIYFLFCEIFNYKITNIYITGNKVINDYKIINLAGISNYPSFIKTSSNNIIKKLENNDFIKNVEVSKKLFGKIYINIEEEDILCINNLGKLITSDGKIIDNNYNVSDKPVLVSDLEKDVFEYFLGSLKKVNKDILLKISQIEYVPTNVDKFRFLLYMNDTNYVYISLDKIDKLNKYNEIYIELNGKKGILNLDSGNSFEIKE